MQEKAIITSYKPGIFNKVGIGLFPRQHSTTPTLMINKPMLLKIISKQKTTGEKNAPAFIKQKPNARQSASTPVSRGCKQGMLPQFLTTKKQIKPYK